MEELLRYSLHPELRLELWGPLLYTGMGGPWVRLVEPEQKGIHHASGYILHRKMEASSSKSLYTEQKKKRNSPSLQCKLAFFGIEKITER